MNKKRDLSVLIKSKRKLFLNTAGEHTRLFNGDGLDFKEIREYSSGDDIRHINWKVTARKRDTNVNVFNEDKQINIVLVYLNSGGIYFGSSQSKQDTMVDIMSILTNTTIRKNDLLTSLFFSSKEEKFYKANKSSKMLELNITTAYNLDVLSKTIDFDALNHYILNKIKQKSLIFFIGDFLDMPNFTIISKKHEVYCAIVRDTLEENLQLSGEFDFIDTSSRDEQNIFLDDNAIKKYNQLMEDYDHKLLSHFSKNNIRYQKIYTNQDPIKQLRKLVGA